MKKLWLSENKNEWKVYVQEKNEWKNYDREKIERNEKIMIKWK